MENDAGARFRGATGHRNGRTGTPAKMDGRVRPYGVAAAVLLAMTIAAGPLAAQVGGPGAPAPDNATSGSPASVPSLDLSDSQRQAIYQSISTRQAKKDTAPPGFRVAIGVQVPASIQLEPLPKAVMELVPKTAAYQYAFVANQVLIVDPQSRTVVEVIH